ncbi:MAG: hypothetical protein WBX15_03570 [Thermoanaerobaculia bacterium]
MKLDRRVPPEVLLVATKVDVRVKDDGGFTIASRQLRDLVEQKMLSYDSRLMKETERPEVVIELDVHEARADETWEQKREYETRQTGTKTEYDSKGNKKTKAVYSSVPIDVNYKKISGTVEAKARVVDAASKREIWSGDAVATFRNSYKKGDGAPTVTDLEKTLVEQSASQIAAKLVGSIEEVSVLVPRGSFDDLVPVAERGEWETYAQRVEAMPPKKRSDDEAFRQYALGVATEALAYRTGKEEETIERLRHAGEYYRKAVELNPREELFAKAYANNWSGGEASSPIDRVESALANYEKLRQFRERIAAVPAASPSPSLKPALVNTAASGGRASAATRSAKRIRNDDVIAMAKAGLGDENIVLAIDAAGAKEFDLSPDGLIALSKAGVSRTVIAHMQKSRK